MKEFSITILCIIRRSLMHKVISVNEWGELISDKIQVCCFGFINSRAAQRFSYSNGLKLNLNFKANMGVSRGVVRIF